MSDPNRYIGRYHPMLAPQAQTGIGSTTVGTTWTTPIPLPKNVGFVDLWFAEDTRIVGNTSGTSLTTVDGPGCIYKASTCPHRIPMYGQTFLHFKSHEAGGSMNGTAYSG